MYFSIECLDFGTNTTLDSSLYLKDNPHYGVANLTQNVILTVLLSSL